MKSLILLCTIALVRTTSVPENCKGVRVANSPVLYEREVLATGLDAHYYHRLAVDYSTNILYFSHSTDGQGSYAVAKIDLNDKKIKNITSIPEGFALAVDSKNHEVYIGGMNGIYKYDPKTDTAVLYGANHTSIWSLFFQDYLYYTVNGAEFLHVIKNGKDLRAAELEETNVDSFVIDKDGDMFYCKDTAVYGRKKDTKGSEMFKKGDMVRKYLTTDKNGTVYLCMYDGIYVVNKDKKTFDKILEIRMVYGIAFDMNNNIIYSDTKGIYILKPNENLTC